MIYTTYFAKLRSLPDDVVPIAICAKVPDWYDGLSWSGLAPDYTVLRDYKIDGDEGKFTERFKQKLGVLRAERVLMWLQRLARSEDIALVCYEKATDFCHRHLVAEWLRENGYECEEL